MFCEGFSVIVEKFNVFILKKLAHIKWDVIIPSSLRLLLKVWIWYRCQNRKLYHHDGETQNTEQKALYYKKQGIAIYLTKTALIRTSNAIFNTKIVDLDKSNRDWLGKLQVILLSAEKPCARTLSKPLRKK